MFLRPKFGSLTDKGKNEKNMKTSHGWKVVDYKNCRSADILNSPH